MNNNMQEKNIVTITGNEANLFWNSPEQSTCFEKPFVGLKNTTREDVLNSTSWVTYHLETTAITEQFRTAQDQKAEDFMLKEAKNIDLILITACNNQEKKVYKFDGENAAKDFESFLIEKQNPLLINYNGFRFADVVLASRGINVKKYSSFDIFLEIYRCVVAAWSVDAIKSRRGWNFDAVVKSSLNKERIALDEKTWCYLLSEDSDKKKKGVDYAKQTAYYLNLLFMHIKSGKSVSSSEIPLSINLLGEGEKE